ncbi:MAG: EAL domain-containing protein [Pseudomonadota bacterium]
MWSLRNIPIRRKLTLLVVVISSVSLLLASIAYITSDRINTQQTVSDNLGTMAAIIAANSSAALLFSDPVAAQETLGFLTSQQHIQAAAIYGMDEMEFASYIKPGLKLEIPAIHLQAENILFWGDYVELFTYIVYEGEQIGFVYLRSDMEAVHERLIWFLGIVALILLASLLVTVVLSAQLQHIITDPLLRLSAIARQVSTEKNYAVRVIGDGKDELGNLITDFNTMLDEIQSRDNELRENRLKLEERVARRTRELEIANEQLALSKEQAESVASRMEYHAHHDALTGLPNRILLNDRITSELAHARRQQTNAALLFLDLDRFKIINDSLGHAIGDQLLRAISRRLNKCVRDEDTVARLGGDEFMILLPRISGSADAGRIAKKIIERLVDPISCNGHVLHITTSIGISIYPYDGTDAETLIKHADISMYRAKELGRNKAVYYTAEMNAGSRKQLAMETSLRKALEKNQLKLFYQPKVDISRNMIIGVEALLRWQHPTMGFISPLEFIPVAEDTGLIVPIGEWVLHTAFRQLKQWHNAGYGSLTLAVNLSSAQLSRPGVEEVVEQALRESGVDAGMTELEVTENVAMENIDSAILILEKLKHMGVSIAMDDFGTGYSSLSYLSRLPFDTVKIDRSFVHKIPDSTEDVTIVEAIIAMAQSLKLSLIVEGVENARQLNFFRQHGVNLVQGYLFSKPVEASELLKMLESQTLPGTVNLVK